MSVNNSQKPINVHKHRSDEFPDVSKLLAAALRFWYLFAIAIVIALAYTFINLSLTLPVYQSKLTLLIKSGKEMRPSQSTLIEGFGLSPEVKDIENQIFVIKSKELIATTIERVDFNISYFQKVGFVYHDIYPFKLFSVEIDSSASQILAQPIHLQYKGNGVWNVSIEADGGTLHRFDKRIDVSGVGEFSFTKQVSANEWIKSPYFTFKIEENQYTNSIEINTIFQVVFKSDQQLVGEYSGINAAQLNEGSSILNMYISGYTPQKLNLFLNEHFKVFQEDNLKQKNEIATRTIDFIQSQLKKVSDTMVVVSDQLEALRKGDFFIEPSALSGRLSEKYLENNDLIAQLNASVDYYKYIQRKLEEDQLGDNYMLPLLAGKGENNQLVVELVTDLMTIQKQLKVVENQAAGDNPYIADLQHKFDTGKIALLNTLSKLIVETQREIALLQDSEVQMKNYLAEMPALQRKYVEIERKYKMNDAIFTFLLQKKSETEISKASNTPDNAVIDEATVIAQIAPNKKSDYTNALIIALLLPAIFVFAVEFFNKSIRDKGELAHLVPDIPVVGFIPHNKVETQNPIIDLPRSVFAESYRAMRTKLNFILLGEEKKVITITSTNTGEGKTFSAFNLATVFAISGKKTALLGFDLRKPRLSEVFDIKHVNGLSSFLIGQSTLEQIVVKSSVPNLDIFPAGAIPPNPSELISGHFAAELFQQLRANYDIILIDTPPLGLVTDAHLLMSLSDATLFVVRVGVTNKSHFVDTIHSLNDNVNHSFGFILNDIDHEKTGYSNYGNGYYS